MLLLVSNDVLHQNFNLKWAFANHLLCVLEQVQQTITLISHF